MSGQIEFDCAQATAFSTVVRRSASSISCDLALEHPGPAIGPEHALGLQARLRERAVAHDRQLALQCQLSAPFRQT